jgi:hypothetical protein
MEVPEPSTVNNNVLAEVRACEVFADMMRIGNAAR